MRALTGFAATAAIAFALSACGGTAIGDDATGGAGGAAGSAGSSATGGAPTVPKAPIPTQTLTCPGAGPNAVSSVAATTGENGTFVDHCDAEGNLVTHHCGTKSEWECNEWECYSQPYPTAEVVEETIDCGGGCDAGRCPSRCPKTGDQIRYAGVDADGWHRIVNQAQEITYYCELLFDSCSLPPVGHVEAVPYYEAPARTCIGTDTAALGFSKVASPTSASCVFKCSAKK